MLVNFPDSFTMVQIQPGAWPARSAFYNVLYTPTVWFDGTIEEVGATSPWQTMYSRYLADYNTRRAVPTDVTISLRAVQTAAQTYQVTAHLCIENGGAGKTMRIYIVQVLDYWPSTATYHRNGFKQAATTADITLAAGGCADVARSFTFDATSWANQEDIRIIAWAQEPQNSASTADPAEVYQAAVLSWPFFTDCNSNGINDPVDISAGTSTDCDDNGLLDECQDDCNANDVADACDISGGTSVDCHDDGVPDECQLQDNDCNFNAVPDDCDIECGLSADCNRNALPDECELAAGSASDCNLNDVLDVCDIAAATSADCNTNLIPDSCELDSGLGPDCNANGVLDWCDINVIVPVSLYFNLDTNPGWSIENLWRWADPTGDGTHNHDPEDCHTGTNCYGYNYTGDYQYNMSRAYYLTAGPFDCSGLVSVELRFWRWLGVDPADRVSIDVSADGVAWTNIWTNPSDVPIAETSWSYQVYDISAVADGSASVYIRWGMRPTDDAILYPGCNIDDVEILGSTTRSKDCNLNARPDECETVTLGDFNADGYVDAGDYTGFAQCMAGPDRPPTAHADTCLDTYLTAFDTDGDGDVDLRDFRDFAGAFDR